MIQMYLFITPNCIAKWLPQPHSELEARRRFFVLRSGVCKPTCRLRDYLQKFGAVRRHTIPRTTKNRSSFETSQS